MPIRILKHEAVPDCGSYEVRLSDPDRPSKFFYWDDVASRRLRQDLATRTEALEAAQAFARGERDKVK